MQTVGDECYDNFDEFSEAKKVVNQMPTNVGAKTPIKRQQFKGRMESNSNRKASFSKPLVKVG
jgi:hypothetical protein